MSVTRDTCNNRPEQGMGDRGCHESWARMWRIAWRMDAYAGPYIPGVDVAVSRSGGGLVAAPRIQSSIQCRPVGGLELDARGRCDYQQEAHTA